ncbi:MAG TPA: aspartate kinase [Myxococcota bacterium]
MSSISSTSTTKTVVLKFGGSSVADVDRLKAVAELVRRRHAEGLRVCVVVSAMGKTTDGLIGLAKQVAAEPPRRELDMLLSTGERASAALLTMALAGLGVGAVSFTGSQAGIITNATHAGARVLEVRPYRVQDELERGLVVVLAGFQGVSYLKEITTLGRGGSDTTAVALAAALDADCEIYSDVDGVWTSDPRVVPTATKIEALSHEEMQELATSGAKVLNAQAVQFAKAKGIAIYARKTGDPGVGTVVRKDAPPPVGGVRGVAHREVLHRLRGQRLEVLPVLLERLERAQQAIGPVSSSGAHFEVLIPPEDAHGLAAALVDLDVERDDVGAVSLVGQGILEAPTLLKDALAVLADQGLTPLGLSTSSFRVTFLVSAGPQVADLARALHARFVTAEREETAA